MKRFAVIGVGNFGFHVAKALFERRNEVIAIDRSKERIQAIEPHCSSAIVQDVTDIEALKGLGLDELDAVIVSTGSNIKYSILICYHLGRIGVGRIVAKAEDDDHGEILTLLGASEIIRPGRDMAERLALRLTSPNMLDLLPLERDYTLVQIDPPPGFIGKSLKQLDLRKRFEINIVAIKQLDPERFVMVPGADYAVKESDILIVLGKTSDLQKIRELG